MKLKHIVTVLFLLLLPFVTIGAQTVEDVTLVTSASAPTEEEAITLALRSAIEQTYGSFVSANTMILNDELVKDEVVGVSHGNVKSYEKLSSVLLPNGQVEVTLNSTISISKLISFAKSKGAEAEFAGQTFAMNMKLMRLKEKNALSAYEHMCIMAGELLDGAFDYKIDLEEPVLAKASIRSKTGRREESGYLFNVNIKVLATPKTSQIYELITNTLNSIRLSETEAEDFIKVGKNVYDYSISYQKKYNQPNDIVLPFSDESRKSVLLLDKTLNKKAIKSFLNYSLVDISNNQSYLSWQDKLSQYKTIQYGDKRVMAWFDLNNRSDKEELESFLYFLCNENEEVSNALIWFSSIDLELYRKLKRTITLESLNSSYNCIPKFVFFSERIDIGTNWNNWRLPVIRKEVPLQEAEQSSLESKNSKSKKQKNSVPKKVIEEYSSNEQVIVEYTLPYFISEEKMNTFSGLKVQTPSLTLQN